MTLPSPTVGLLYPGEMGASVARVLRARGVPVVTVLAGRGERSHRRCVDAGIEVLGTLADLARASDVVISLVPPDAAGDVARSYCEHERLAPPSALYVDANSIGPALAGSLAARFATLGRGFVDAAINGLAANLTTSGTLYLSGARAGEVARLVEPAVRVRVLGDTPGRASAMKMLLAGVSKGVSALFLELARVASSQDMLGEMLEATASVYPGVSAVAERMLPTYGLHAVRRAAEMRELERTARAAGVEPHVIVAVREAHEVLARMIGTSARHPNGAACGSLEALVRLYGDDDASSVAIPVREKPVEI